MSSNARRRSSSSSASSRASVGYGSRSPRSRTGSTPTLVSTSASVVASSSARRSMRWCRTEPIPTPSAMIDEHAEHAELDQQRRPPQRARMSRESTADGVFLRRSAARPYSQIRCPRATRSTTRRIASARCSRATCRTSWRRRIPASRATAGPSGWPGRAVAAVDAHGKHLFLRFEGGLTIHSHLRMTGSWRVLDARGRWPALAAVRVAADPPRRARGAAVQRPGARADDRLAHAAGPPDRRPGPGHPRARARRGRLPAPAARGRPDAPDRRRAARPAHDRGDREPVEGEGCFAAAIDPWRRTGEVSDEEALAIVHETRPRMRASATDGRQDRFRVIYGRAGLPCPRCGRTEALDRAGARAGRRQPADLLVRALPGMSARSRPADRPQGRRPHRARATRRRASTRRWRRAST